MKTFYTVLLLLLAVSIGYAQGRDRFEKGGGKNQNTETEEQEPEEQAIDEPLNEQRFIDRLRFGGNLGLQFGTTTAIFLAPKVGYQATQDLIVGTGFIYQYLAFDYEGPSGRIERFEAQTAGPLVFANYIIGNSLYTGAQFEYLNHDAPIIDASGTIIDIEQIWSPVLFLEAGYNQQIGSRSSLRIGVRYNVLHQGARSPYATAFFPVIGVFF